MSEAAIEVHARKSKSTWTIPGLSYFAPSLRGFVSVLTVAGAHLLFFWVLVVSFRGHFDEPVSRTIEVRIVNVPRPNSTPSPELVPANIVVVPSPDIQITSEAASSAAVVAIPGSELLPPRPDPDHHNRAPVLPAQLAAKMATQVILRILVQQDGSISDAQVTTSSGQAEVDRFAVEFAKANWRYLPALAGRAPVPDWTTAVMRFAKA